MIEIDSAVKFNGTVTTVGAASYDVDIDEFFIDDQWRRFIEPKTLTIATADYDNHLTPSELTFIQNSIERIVKTMALEDCDLQVAESIIKKLKS